MHKQHKTEAHDVKRFCSFLWSDFLFEQKLICVLFWIDSPENRIFVPRILSIVFQAPNPPLLKYVLETKDPDLFYFRL